MPANIEQRIGPERYPLGAGKQLIKGGFSEENGPISAAGYDKIPVYNTRRAVCK